MTDRPQDRLLYALKSGGPQTATVLARKLAVTAVAVRQQLERLQDQDLVTFEDLRAGVGRPKRVWSLTRAGHDRFPDNHSGLMLQMLESMQTVFGAEGVDRLIDHRERQSLADYQARLADAGDTREKLRRLAQARSEEGYMAEVEDESATSALLVENHCPICVAARACQGLCRSELAVFRAALGADVSVERVEHLLAGARRCAYRVSWEPHGA